MSGVSALKDAWTENERSVIPLFDRALALRDQGSYDEAIVLLQAVVDRLTLSDRRLLAHTHVQLGRLHDRLGNDLREEEHYRIAVRVAPRWEHASLSLFYSLQNLKRHEDAMREMLRLVSLHDSDGYREVLEEGFSHQLSPLEHDIVGKVRSLLAQYRNGRNV
jgi:tetratricopeptide (TPR) repeat protein